MDSRRVVRCIRYIMFMALWAAFVVPYLSVATVTEAADPGGSIIQGGSGPPDAAAQRPGNHDEESAYLASLHQDAKGRSPGQARLDAFNQAQKVTQAKALPVAKNGKGTKVEPGKELAAPFGQWHQLGPAPLNSTTSDPATDYQFGIVSGRITALAIGPNTGIIYVGTAGGGVWKSTDDGVTWAALTDNQPTLVVGSLALDPTDTTDNTLYVGTGEANSNLDQYNGIGVLKTTDGGATWRHYGQDVFGTRSNAIGVMVARGNTVYAGTTQGLYVSTNAMSDPPTWTLVTVASTASNAAVSDLAVDNLNVYAVVSGDGIGKAYTGVYRSTTGGTSADYQAIMNGLPAGAGWRRAQIAMAPSSPPTLYLVIADGKFNLMKPNGLFKTTTRGDTWAPTNVQPPNFLNGTNAPTGQGFYDLAIAVDPAEVHDVYVVGENAVASTDGGNNSWTTIADTLCGGILPCTPSIHSDMHAIAFGRTGVPRHVYVGTDGGLFKTTNPTARAGTQWTSLNAHLATIQFYGGDSAANYTTNPIVVGGAQDNGNARFAIYGGYGTWNALTGGDGGYVGIDPTNPNTVYMEYYNGSLYKTTNADQQSAIKKTSITPLCSDAGKSPLFVTPITVDHNPANNRHLLYGAGGHVCESVDGGITWAVSVTMTDPLQSVAIAPSNSSVLYAGTINGAVWRATDGNPNPLRVATWQKCAATNLPASPVTSIAIDPNDTNTVYVTIGASGVGQIWKTTNCTDPSSSWRNISGDRVANPLFSVPDAPLHSVVTYASTQNPTIIVGGDVGVFVTNDDGKTWNRLQNVLPGAVHVWQLFTDAAQTTLFAATHGRGMWEIPIPANSAAGISFSSSPVAFGDVPIGTSANQTLTVTNNGTAPVVIGQVIFANPPSITKTADTCSAMTIQPNLQCTISFTFTPTLPGGSGGQLMFNDNLAGTPQYVNVVGNGTGGGTATFQPASFGYGSRAINTDNFHTFEIQNTGSGTLNVTGISMTPNSGAFSVFANGCTQPVNSGSSCFINVNFRPGATQSYSATLDFTDDALNSPQHVQISGLGIGAIQMSPRDIDFGTRDTNVSGTVPRTVTITNVSANSIAFGATDVSVAGVNAGDFLITSNSCASSMIAPTSSCRVDVQFKANGVGARQGRISVTVPGQQETDFTTLEGFGVNGVAPAATINPNPIAFGNTPFSTTVGLYRNYMYVTLQNSGASAMQNISVSVDTTASDDHADFGIDSSPCDGGGLVLQPGEACRMYLHFIPQQTIAGSRSATLLVASNANAPGSPMRVPLTGTAVDPASFQRALVGVSALTDFGSHSLNNSTQQSPRIFSWGNLGFAVDTITLAADSPNAGDFQLSGEFGCEISYGPSVAGSPPPSCSFGVIFTPKGAGKRQAYIDVTFLNNVLPPVRMYLAGIGLSPAVTLDKTSLTFTNVTIGTTAAQDVKITNSGGALLTIQNIGSDGAHFGAYYPNCSTLQPGATCTFQVKFTAYVTTPETATIVITDNTSAGSDTIAVTGMGSQPVTTTVSTTDDVIANDGKCSLREAIIAANTNNASGAAAGECPAGGTGGTILLAKGAVYNLTIAPAGADDATTGDLNILASVSIAVTNGGSATIDAGGRGRVMTIGASGTSCTPTVNITGVTLINGKLSSGSVGHSGGGLDIYCGAVKLTDSAVANSSALNNGGGIAQQGGDLQVIRSTIDGNTAVNGGGGIYSAGTLTVVTSTIYGNSASSGGGIDAHLDLALTSDTITGNSTGVHNGVNYPIQVQGTIFANVGANCITTPNGGFFSSGGYNLDSRDNCTFRQTGDLHDVNPNLGPLVLHGGLTQTQALLAGSPAIDQIPATNAICQGTKDQQGFSRPFGPACDIGAYEYTVVAVAPPQRPSGNPPLPPGSAPPVPQPAGRSSVPLPPGSPPPVPAPAGR